MKKRHSEISEIMRESRRQSLLNPDTHRQSTSEKYRIFPSLRPKILKASLKADIRT